MKQVVPSEVGGLLGQYRRAGLSVRLAHHLHTFLESQERSRFDELRLELLLHEKLWAVEASRLERDLGSFGIRNASHGSHESQSANMSALPFSQTHDARALVWRRKSRGISGCACVDCWGTAILGEDPCVPCVPCKSALAQTGILPKTSQLTVPTYSTYPTYPDAVDLAGLVHGAKPDQATSENFRDYHEHLQLLLAARASVMAAESSLERLKSAKAMASSDDLRSIRSDASAASPTSPASAAAEAAEGRLGRLPDIRSAGLKQLMALQKATATPSPDGQHSQDGQDGQDGRQEAEKKIVVEQKRNSKLQEHLSHLNSILSTPAMPVIPVTPHGNLEPVERWEPVEIERSDEITAEFANSFLQLAEARASEMKDAETRNKDDLVGLEHEGVEGTTSADGPQPVEPVAVDTVEAPKVPRETGAEVVQVTEMTPTVQMNAGQIGQQEAPAVDSVREALQPQSFVERAAARKQKLLQWKHASDFLRDPLDPLDPTSRWQLPELLMEADYARSRLREVLKHKQRMRKLYSTELPSTWLKRRVRSAQEALVIALQPPWEKNENLDRAEKIERILQSQSSRRGKSQILSLTACVEAVVAAYDVERGRVWDLCEKPQDAFGEETEQSQGRDLALQALEREVAKSLRSISECRRLLLDLLDKGAIARGSKESKESKASEQMEEQSSQRSKSAKSEAKVDNRRRSAWAKVYADLLQIDAKDSTTITLKTSQGVAWAKT